MIGCGWYVGPEVDRKNLRGKKFAKPYCCIPGMERVLGCNGNTRCCSKIRRSKSKTLAAEGNFGPFASKERIENYAPVIDEEEPFPAAEAKLGKTSWCDIPDICGIAQDRRDIEPGCKSVLKTVNTDLLAVPITGDWHFGSMFTRYEEIEKFHKFLLSHKEMKILIAGDTVDNFACFRSAAPILEQIVPPDMQWMWFYKLMEEYNKNEQVLAVALGNHEGFLEKVGHLKTIMRFMKNDIPMMDNIGLLNLKVGKIPYRIVLAHKLRGSSMYNQTHASMRLLREHAPTADVVVSAHTHTPAGAYEYRYALDEMFGGDFTAGGMKFYVKPGSPKLDDPFSWKGYGPAKFHIPTLVFHGDTKHIEQFQNPQAAADYILGVRAGRKDRK